MSMNAESPPTPDFCAPWSVEKRDQKHRKKNAVYMQDSVMEKDCKVAGSFFSLFQGAPGS